MKRNVFILNYASHYRLPIFKQLEKDLYADFYFGNIAGSSIKKLNYSLLGGFKKEFKTIFLKNFSWLIGSISVIFKPYNNYVLTGDPQILSNWFILIIGKMMGKRVHLWTHGLYGREEGLRLHVKLMYFRLAHSLILYNDYGKDLLLKKGFSATMLVPIYNSLDYENQIIIRNNLTKSSIMENIFHNENPVLVYIGRIQRSKKLEQVIEAMKILKSSEVNVNFLIIGKDSEGTNLEHLVEENGMKNVVHFYGACYDERILAELIYNSNICISPGNVGLTAIHSLMYGTPVVTHNDFTMQGPEFECITDGANGAFFEMGNSFDLSKKIVDLLNKGIKKEDCFKVIDEKWNSNSQTKILKKLCNENRD